MTATALLDVLQARGVTVRIDSGDLKLKPAGGLDAALLGEVRAHKAEILQALQSGVATHQAEPTKRPVPTRADRMRYRAGRAFAAGQLTANELGHLLGAAVEVEAGRQPAFYPADVCSPEAVSEFYPQDPAGSES